MTLFSLTIDWQAVESSWVNASFLESTMKEVEEKTIDGIKVLLKKDGGAFCFCISVGMRQERHEGFVLFLINGCVTEGAGTL